MRVLGVQRRVHPWRPCSSSDNGTKTARFDFDFVEDAQKPGRKKKRKPRKVVLDFTLHRLGVFPVIQNIVATYSLGTKLDLSSLVRKLRNVEYNKRKFPAMIMRRREPKTTALIFESGKVVVTGATSRDDSQLAARKVARCVQRVNPCVRCKNYHIENVVANFEAPFAVSLTKIATQHAFNASYEPEIFPGLSYDMQEPKCVCLVFSAGKVVITGLKRTEDIKIAFETIYDVLEGARLS
jgi:transcription initiation factor TFIID TATA-box-binding protein